MLETLGFVTLQDADDTLEFNIQYDYWNDTGVYEETTGTWSTSGSSVNLVGVGTLATTELAVSDIIAIQYETAIVDTITDNTNIILDEAVDTTVASPLVIVTSTQRTTLEAMWLLKKKCLLTAYGYLTTYCNIPDTVPQVLKDAQCYLAAVMYQTNGASTVPSGQAGNVKSYSIGDMSYTFNTSVSLSGNTPYEIFPVPIYDMIKPYLKNQKSFATVTTSAR